MTNCNGFIRLDHSVVRSETWAGLSPRATRLIIGIWNQYNGKNNGDLRFGNAHAVRLLRCSASTAVRTFAELKEAGLIECVQRSSFADKAGSRKGMATTWRITVLK